MTGVGGEWRADPSRRHEYRYWDGTQWSEHASSLGRVLNDPLGADAARFPPPPPGGPSPAPVQPVYVAVPRNNGLAIASMVLGIVWMYWIGSILAIIFGHVALSQIKKSGGAQRGRGMAIAGVVLGYVGIALLVAFIVVAATVDFDVDNDPTGSTCRTDALEVSIAENAYHVVHGTYVTEAELVAAEYLDEQSDLHDVVILDGGADYRITPTARCVSPRVARGARVPWRSPRGDGAAT
jgi:hypothetical protein